MSMNIRRNKIRALHDANLWAGVMPLIILAFLFIIFGSLKYETTTAKLEVQNKRVRGIKAEIEEIQSKETLDEAELERKKNKLSEERYSLNIAKYQRSIVMLMLISAGIMIVHSAALFGLRSFWFSSFATISIVVVTYGILRKVYDIGSTGTNILYIYLGAVIAFITIIATSRKFYVKFHLVQRDLERMGNIPNGDEMLPEHES